MARTGNRGAIAQTGDTARRNKTWNVGLYMRLSREEFNNGGNDSNSIVHQLKLLNEFCLNHDDHFTSVTEYADDGYSGTDTNREQFQRLISDVMSKRTNCVIVKDLSRLSRNYSDAGSLIESLFVEMDVRFISLSEDIDSYTNPDSVSSLIVPITNVMNDNYCYQTSKKVRQVFDYKRRNGEFIGSFATYGYIKDPQNKHVLLIDEEAAEVVREIYECFLRGMSKYGIVRMLNARGVLPPADYKRRNGSKYRSQMDDGMSLWSKKTINLILKNRIYVGDMVQGRSRIKSYKVHKRELLPEDEWCIVENTHEPIIDRDMFTRVQSLHVRDTRTAPAATTLYIFIGFLHCADCGKGMSRTIMKDYTYYYCRTYKDLSKEACTKHTMRHDKLEAAVLYAIRQQIERMVDYSETIAVINAAPTKRNQSERLNTQLASKSKELAKLERHKLSLYHDFKEDIITRDDYKRLTKDYVERIDETRDVITRLNTERDELAKGIDTENPCVAAFRRHRNIDQLSRELLVELVDEILIHENGEITIRFTFADEMRRVEEFIEVNAEVAVDNE